MPHNVPIIVQLMHGGRVSDSRCIHEGESPVSASATHIGGWVLYTDTDEEKQNRGLSGEWPKVTFPPARELTEAEIERVADGFAEAAKRAVEAGCDGVEIHGANGYLYYQFIHPKTNHRTDSFGGSAANNVRAAKLACRKVREAIGPDKIITLRLSQDDVDDFPGAWPGGVEYARELGRALADCDADALHWSSFNWKDNCDPNSDVPMATAIAETSGKPMIVNGGIADGADAEEVLDTGTSIRRTCAFPIGIPAFRSGASRTGWANSEGGGRNSGIPVRPDRQRHPTLRKKRHDFGCREQVGVFVADVEKVGFVRSERPVADAIGGDDRPEIVAHGVDDAGADATAGRAAGENQRVDPSRDKHACKMRPEKCRRLRLAENQFAGARRQRLDNLTGMRRLD